MAFYRHFQGWLHKPLSLSSPASCTALESEQRTGDPEPQRRGGKQPGGWLPGAK